MAEKMKEYLEHWEVNEKKVSIKADNLSSSTIGDTYCTVHKHIKQADILPSSTVGDTCTVHKMLRWNSQRSKVNINFYKNLILKMVRSDTF